MTEQEWHQDRFMEQGNSCGQDTFYYCSELYNPQKSFATTYDDYQDCVKSKTLSDCGHDFTTSGPNQWSGGKNPYELALKADAKHLRDKINEIENYDPEVGYDSDELIEEWNEEHPNYEYGDDEPLDIPVVNIQDEDKKMMYIALGAVGLIGLIVIIK